MNWMDEINEDAMWRQMGAMLALYSIKTYT